MPIEISVIICTYNRDKFIYRTLEHIACNGFPADSYEIILIDNNSTDQTATECRRFSDHFPEVNFHYFIETQQGLSFARNRGIQEAQGDILLFLDDDAFMQKDYLHRLSGYLKSYPDAVAFGGKITPLYESGKVPEWMSKWTYSWVSAINKGTNVCLFEGNSYPIGANMGFRRASIPQEGFNTALGRNKGNLMGGEEKDIFNRMKARNARIYYFPDIEVLHVIPEKRTTREYIKQMAWGIGKSERLRTLKISRFAYMKRLGAESIKWCASLLLYVGYSLRGTVRKGKILLYFRWFVSKGLISTK
ncbi:MAG: glycosyltransferase [Odoribacter sp.]|nr:glycosyltransferase [Odoribacter sp.]